MYLFHTNGENSFSLYDHKKFGFATLELAG